MYNAFKYKRYWAPNTNQLIMTSVIYRKDKSFIKYIINIILCLPIMKIEELFAGEWYVV